MFDIGMWPFRTCPKLNSLSERDKRELLELHRAARKGQNQLRYVLSLVSKKARRAYYYGSQNPEVCQYVAANE